MPTTHRRYWVYFLLFLFSAIAYVDRVNMSVAGKPIAHEFGLSPIALGYLFFLVPVGLCPDDAARRAADRPLGPACRRFGRDRSMVDGANGDRNGRQLLDDVDGAARSGAAHRITNEHRPLKESRCRSATS